MLLVLVNKCLGGPVSLLTLCPYTGTTEAERLMLADAVLFGTVSFLEVVILRHFW